MIGVKVNSEEFTSKMGRRDPSEARNPRAVMAGVGREGANQLRAHFRKKDQTDINRLAPDRREHFWRQVMNATNAPVVSGDGNTVTILINHPAIAQKIFGGDIRAKRVRNLAIPEEPEAYGRSPRSLRAGDGHQADLHQAAKTFCWRKRSLGADCRWNICSRPKFTRTRTRRRCLRRKSSSGVDRPG
jgi:hypothetical protein